MQSNRNCLFRADFYELNGSEGGHGKLRELVASYIEESGCILSDLLAHSPDDGKLLPDHIKYVRTLGNAVGEDAILAVANVCKRDVTVYLADAEPLVYE